MLGQHLTLATICCRIRELSNANVKIRVVVAVDKNLFVPIIELGKLSLGQCS